MAEFVKKPGPPNIKAANSNTLSDSYRDAITIAYQFICSTVASTVFSFAGRTFDTPIMAGPVGVPAPGKAPGESDLDFSKAVSAAGSVYWGTFHHPEAWKATLAEGVPAIRTIKPLADMDRILEEVAYDTEHGAIGYAMDIDHGITAYGALDAQKEPFAPKTLSDLRTISEASPLPFYMKSILSVHDAILAAEAGAAGIVISAHNNRFPCAVPPLKILPAIRKAVGKDFTILVDGGMNSGYDVFKALALGADGVLTARALAAAFAQEGADGLTQKILEMTAELKGAMANTGSPDLAHINPDCLILP